MYGLIKERRIVAIEELEYAGFWIRVWASIIDTILVLLLTTPLMVMFYGRDYALNSMGGGMRPLELVITWVLPAIAVIAFWRARLATPGKMAIGAKIVDAATGEAPSTGQLVGRYLGYFVSAIPLCLGLVWVAFDPRKQGWHDKLAGTVVVRRKNRGPEPVSFAKPDR
ncbi:RDD family protein [Piscinibacter sp.]|uniref:RDD family protein n=1 Tax=Piscinibacter sp. TaxID=1903157 RepID=UPI003559F502